jgi:DNA-binding response OmpR family regulator
MRYPQLIIYETDGRLAQMLEGTAGTHRWVLRQPRRLEACLRLLRNGVPAILIVRLENDLEAALSLVAQTVRLFPDAVAVVVCDSEEPVLADLAWDLGAAYVLVPSQPRELLVDVVANFMGDAPSGNEPA